jgi:glucan biosynthesis protein C
VEVLNADRARKAQGKGAAPSPAGKADSAAAPEDSRQERQHHLDALRSILMMLGVFLHASYLYAPHTAWLVKDGESSRVLLWVNESIHFFRIPCFFILSGFFAQMLLEKQGRAIFLRSRMRRLALPLASTAILLNTVQARLLHSARGDDGGMAATPGPQECARYLGSGEWVGHLWFLVYVIGYSAATLVLWAAWKAPWTRTARAWTRAHARSFRPGLAETLVSRGLFMLLLPLAHLAVLAAVALLPFLYANWGGLSGYAFLQFLPYYAFGLVIFRNRRLRDEFQRVRPWQALSIPAALALTIHLHRWSGADWARAVIHGIDAYLVWSTCALLFAAFRALLNRKHPAFAYLSEASYSIYLFHHVCVVALGLYLAGKDWGVFLEFGLVAGASLAISLAAHHFLILRVRILRLLFQGK